MKNCTNHFIERWVERIIGIEDEQERALYISKNKKLIVENANKTFEYADFLYKGQIGDNVTRHYYIEDDIIFVANTTDDALITVYRVDLGFPDKLNADVRKGLVDEIKKLRYEKEEIELKSMSEVEDKKHKVENIIEQIKILEQQVDNLKKEKSFIEEEIKIISNRSSNIDLEIKKYTMFLVDSKGYREDLRNAR